MVRCQVANLTNGQMIITERNESIVIHFIPNNNGPAFTLFKVSEVELKTIIMAMQAFFSSL
jgi:hypothetical protein